MRNYGVPRRAWERLQRTVTIGRWPARVAVRMGTRLDVALEHHEIIVAGPLGRAGRLRIGFVSPLALTRPLAHGAIVDARVSLVSGTGAGMR